MPIRGLLYFARFYEAYIKKYKLDIYGRGLVKLPSPQFVVFYNGRENQPDEMIIRLSDAFVPELNEDAPVLECMAKMININYGHNKALWNSCRRLHDYSYFVAKVNTYLDEGVSLNIAINNAVNYCIDNDILSDILIKCKSEVFDMLLTEYDEKLHAKTLYNEGYEDGMLEERNKNILNTIDMLKSLNLPNETIIQMIAEKYELPEESISKML